MIGVVKWTRISGSAQSTRFATWQTERRRWELFVHGPVPFDADLDVIVDASLATWIASHAGQSEISGADIPALPRAVAELAEW
jgi:hypothetical protein